VDICLLNSPLTNPFPYSVTLLVSFLSFLTAIWSPGIVFAWLVNLGSISTLVVWMSIGWVSLRFRMAWRAQGRTLTDLPYKQPLFPLLPGGALVLGTTMFVAEGYGAVTSGGGAKVTHTFVPALHLLMRVPQSIVATYIGLAVYIILYVGYAIYQRVTTQAPYFVPLLEVDLDSDAVWGKGEGAAIKEHEAQERKDIIVQGGWSAWKARVAN
jgi:amino acid permease